MDFLSTYSTGNWVLILLAAFIIGLSKAGLKGIDMMNVTIMAIVFGGKASTGIVLPLLCFTDVMAVIFRRIMAAIIILTIILVIVLEFKKHSSMPENKFFGAGMGLVSGFTTMLG